MEVIKIRRREPEFSDGESECFYAVFLGSMARGMLEKVPVLVSFWDDSGANLGRD